VCFFHQHLKQYRAKFDLFQSELGHLLPLQKPDAGFYYWLKVDNDETYGFLQHGFHRSTLRLKQAGVVLALQRRDRCGIANSELGHLLPLQKPDAGFYYWLKVDNDETFAKMLMASGFCNGRR
jgi:aspartate/methionine/tyrosine aminotransferase